MKGTNLNLAFNLETIYENANFQLGDLDKVGIVGVNGAGKTTLFKIILKELSLDSGKIEIDKKKRIGYLPQEIIMENKEMTVFEYLMTARPIETLEKELIKLYEEVAIADAKNQKKLFSKIAQTQELLEYYDYYAAENIMLEIISSMNIDTELLDMKLVDLSGGQKSKVAFAHLLYSNPEIMLLDEPTNHLDVDTRQYIIKYLQKYKGLVLIISHDITFLDTVVNKIMHIDKQKKDIKVYEGNYTTYQKKKEQEQKEKERMIEKQDREIEKLRSIVLQYSNSSGKRKRMAESREKMLNKKMKTIITKDEKQKRVKLNLKPNRESGKIPIKVNNLYFGYTEKQLIQNLSFHIDNKERFLIVGENGVGKSTLLKLLVGALKPDEGQIWTGNKTDIAYYAQEQETLDLDKTILENVTSNTYTEKELRTVLGNFLFTKEDTLKQVKVLSPGEKARVALCKIVLEKANFLVLDEPTNHLDPETQRIIGENFKNYDGTILLVSHNPSFVESIGISRMLLLPSGKITNYSKEQLEYYYKLNTKHVK